MAAIFKAYDPELGRHVAIKELPTYQADEAAFVEVFRREAQAVAQLNHPNIVQVYDFGEDKGFAYIVMEHLNGGTLLERMERRLPIDAVLEYIRPVAGALEYAHGRGTVHRDVKPGNILLDDDGKPILCDFGLARMLDDSDATSGTGTVTGTPEYMAPEQALGRQPDHRTDIYALAVIVYQMLLGRTPFRAGTAAATLLAYIHEPVPLPSSLDPGLDPALETVLIKGLAKSPADRCLAATDLVNALAGEDSQPETRAGFVTTAQDYLSTQTDLAKWANLPEPKKAPVLGGDPQFIREGRSFPQLGISFLKRISRAGQWETVRLVYTNPPASTEQIFHPEKYQTGEKPVVVALPDLDVVLGEEWTEVFSSVLGERLLKDYLASLNGSDPEEAAGAGAATDLASIGGRGELSPSPRSSCGTRRRTPGSSSTTSRPERPGNISSASARTASCWSSAQTRTLSTASDPNSPDTEPAEGAMASGRETPLAIWVSESAYRT
jgi:serine/threonine-protein kinase